MDKKELGIQIKAARKAAGKTQEELANDLGIGRGSVSQWETGHTFPRGKMLSRIADALDVEVRQLLCPYDALEIAEPREELAAEKLADIEEARKLYEEADKLIKKADAIIRRNMSGNVDVCGHTEFEKLPYDPYKGMIPVHLYKGIMRFEELLDVKTEPEKCWDGSVDKKKKVLCVNGIKFFQLGEATESNYCYR